MVSVTGPSPSGHNLRRLCTLYQYPSGVTGPKDKAEALRWIQQAVRDGKHEVTYHFDERCRERGLGLFDAEQAIEQGRSCEAYVGMPEHYGTCWRIRGPSIDGDEIVVGVEAFTRGKKNTRVCILVTLFRGDE